MSDLFSTDLLPITDRLNAWLFRARQICGDCRFQFPSRPTFTGCIERRAVAGLELTRFSSTPVSFRKFPVVSADSPERGCIIITQLEGIRLYRQEGAEAMLSPGDTTLLDSGRPWSSNCAGRCSRLYLRVPMWVMQNRLRLKTIPTLPRICGARGTGAALFRLMSSLYQQAETFAPDEGASAIDGYLEMLSACLLGLGAVRSRALCGNLSQRIERFIQTNLASPTLNPPGIAEAAGISLRHLHRIFSGRGCTVANWVREQRLARCSADLANQRLAERTITDIAFSWGFSDSAHFSRCFKEHFGITPRRFRVQALQGSWELSRARVSATGAGARLWQIN